ncbi:MAG: hypothetical protein R3200_12420 [Xanthomonadales bacterium]|nr:hypothetical protein [Xanthomonadales bacterium]
MTYQCLSCTYKAKVFPGGVCPGCGSPKIQRLDRPQEKEKTTRKPYRLLLAGALWAYLFYVGFKQAGFV